MSLLKMKSFSTNQILASLNVFIVLLILADCFLLPPQIINDKFDYTIIRTIRGKSGAIHEVQEINTISGRILVGPDDFYLPLIKGCDLIITKASLSNKNLFGSSV